MTSKWKKVKMALSMNACLYVPRTDQDEPSAAEAARRLSDAVSVSSPAVVRHQPRTPTPSSYGLLLSRSGSKSSKVRSFLHDRSFSLRSYLFPVILMLSLVVVTIRSSADNDLGLPHSSESAHLFIPVGEYCA